LLGIVKVEQRQDHAVRQRFAEFLPDFSHRISTSPFRRIGGAANSPAMRLDAIMLVGRQNAPL
jgi:hypothetical protein